MAVTAILEESASNRSAWIYLAKSQIVDGAQYREFRDLQSGKLSWDPAIRAFLFGILARIFIL